MTGIEITKPGCQNEACHGPDFDVRSYTGPGAFHGVRLCAFCRDTIDSTRREQQHHQPGPLGPKGCTR